MEMNSEICDEDRAFVQDVFLDSSSDGSVPAIFAFLAEFDDSSSCNSDAHHSSMVSFVRTRVFASIERSTARFPSKRLLSSTGVELQKVSAIGANLLLSAVVGDDRPSARSVSLMVITALLRRIRHLVDNAMDGDVASFNNIADRLVKLVVDSVPLFRDEEASEALQCVTQTLRCNTVSPRTQDLLMNLLSSMFVKFEIRSNALDCRRDSDYQHHLYFLSDLSLPSISSDEVDVRDEQGPLQWYWDVSRVSEAVLNELDSSGTCSHINLVSNCAELSALLERKMGWSSTSPKAIKRLMYTTDSQASLALWPEVLYHWSCRAEDAQLVGGSCQCRIATLTSLPPEGILTLCVESLVTVAILVGYQRAYQASDTDAIIAYLRLICQLSNTRLLLRVGQAVHVTLSPSKSAKRIRLATEESRELRHFRALDLMCSELLRTVPVDLVASSLDWLLTNSAPSVCLLLTDAGLELTSVLCNRVFGARDDHAALLPLLTRLVACLPTVTSALEAMSRGVGSRKVLCELCGHCPQDERNRLASLCGKPLGQRGLKLLALYLLTVSQRLPKSTAAFNAALAAVRSQNDGTIVVVGVRTVLHHCEDALGPSHREAIVALLWRLWSRLYSKVDLTVVVGLSDSSPLGVDHGAYQLRSLCDASSALEAVLGHVTSNDVTATAALKTLSVIRLENCYRVLWVHLWNFSTVSERTLCLVHVSHSVLVFLSQHAAQKEDGDEEDEEETNRPAKRHEFGESRAVSYVKKVVDALEARLQPHGAEQSALSSFRPLCIRNSESSYVQWVLAMLPPLLAADTSPDRDAWCLAVWTVQELSHVVRHKLTHSVVALVNGDADKTNISQLLSALVKSASNLGSESSIVLLQAIIECCQVIEEFVFRGHRERVFSAVLHSLPNVSEAAVKLLTAEGRKNKTVSKSTTSEETRRISAAWKLLVARASEFVKHCDVK